MKIISLQAENIKKLVAVEIKPDGNMVEITGRNGQGKTSVLDSIWWALSGATNIPGRPIRKGEFEARIKLDLGEIVVTRTFKIKDDKTGEYTTSLSVLNADGSKFGSPQAMLDGLLGSLTFDPLEFSRMEPKQQFNTLSRFVPDVDFHEIETQNEGDYAKRTELNRKAKDCRTLAEKIIVPAGGVMAAVDDSALIDQLQQASSTNTDILTRKNNRDLLAKKAMTNRQEAKRLVDEAVTIEKKLADAPPLPEPVDVDALRQKIAEAQEINADVARRDARKKHMDDAKVHQDAADGLSRQMDAREAEKRDKIAAATLPVPGLGFGDGFITLNGVPFDQASDAEQLRASIAIAMASNPKLRVIRVRDGSLLDDQAMKLLGEMANAQDMQVWIERVASDGKVGFVLEDGQVKKKEITK